MRLDHAFFCVQPPKKSNVKNAIASLDKIKDRKKRDEKGEESEVMLPLILLLAKYFIHFLGDKNKLKNNQ